MNNIFKSILRKIFRRKIIKNFNKYCPRKEGHVLLYYKTDYYSLGGLLEDRSHTNEWESYEIAKVFNQLGFWVDIADRTISKNDIEKLEDKYDVFFGIGAGDSGQYFVDIAKKLTKAKKILYALGPEPNLSNRITKERHDYFLKRHPGSDIVVRRLIKEVDIDESMKFVDAIVTNCNEWGIEGYKKFEKPIERVWLSSFPSLRTTFAEIKEKDQTKFLYFGGNGNITKGLDLAIEAFAKLPHLELYIGAPKTEEDFNIVINPIIDNTPNIKFIGFMDVKSEKFSEISSKCAYVILPSSSEGCATSVTTCMRRGLVPIVTEESGVDIGNFGFLLKSIKVGDLVEQISEVSNLDNKDYVRRSVLSYIESQKYTQSYFSHTLEKALLTILSNIHAK
mgnify:CR=1 FL=1